MTVTGSTVQTDGTFPNTLTATVQGTALSAQFAADAIYSWVTHVDPIWSPAGCLGCHVGAGTSGLALDNTASTNYSALVGVVPVCDGTLGSSYRRVSSAGGTSAATDFSILMRLVDPGVK